MGLTVFLYETEFFVFNKYSGPLFRQSRDVSKNNIEQMCCIILLLKNNTISSNNENFVEC